ncbi:MAG: MFS transporter [Alphaproteobacteria bacterium]|jgi:MFS family permease|nr:MFS transporter [Alphaproteobacteria bacterium]MDP6517872.1 MFS transporter [Alphaproteobacteria bacterium]
MPALILIVFIDLLGFGIIIPLLPFYAEHFGAGPALVTMLMAIYSLTQFAAAPIIGALSDRYGRRKVILLSLAGTAGAYLLMAFAGSLAMLFVARALAGVLAGNIAAAQAAIADLTEPKDRARGMGLFGAAFGLGFIFGPLIGGVLTGADPAAADFQTPPLVAAGLSALAFGLGLAVLRESRPPGALASVARRRWLAPVLGAVRRPDMRLLVAVFFLVMLAFAGLEATFALWAERQFAWGPRPVGYLFAYVGVIAALVQGALIGPLTRRYGEERVMLAGVGALIGGFMLLPAATGLAHLLVAMALLAGGFGLANPALHALISRRADAEGQGATLGIAQSGASLARIVGPVCAGAVFAAWGRHWPYVIGALLLAIAATGAWRLVRARLAPEQ